jgi:spermidine/putrescine transport system permease protein
MIASRRRPRLLGVFAVVLLLFLYAPLVIAVIYAFNDSRRLTWPPSGFSLMWFREIFSDDLFRRALTTSVTAAVLTAAAAGVIGTAAAFVITRRRSRLARVSEGFGLLPVMLPPLFIAVGLLAAMKATNTTPGMLTIVIGHTLVAIPFVIIIVVARLRTFDIELEYAARDLGAGPGQVLRRITLPIVAPAILGAMLLAFAVSFDEVLITNFTSGTRQTVPIYVFGRLRRYIDPGANAVATILLLVPWVAFAIGAIFLRRSGTRATALQQQV